ncbi:maleylpyruvate isomerase N-terminal domain-containing protein [Curtobacterium sp. MCLR17_007]|uniref:maleylpyruvate isomerase N-terminal domain-containing protein n=1 Tax=Curtobacterium sp. MCLR17_007 TaxID=2175648 RepID=UPI000DAA0800|nr:maleylpyruvate isomerase N-terminal domain-containing protein [Curtobacterium sp. MCLR17_007]WIB61208.1 maleylpyruvate isomerase N-terminal domain-containing protein [Curtobacterium sp. MCLR17_007]
MATDWIALQALAAAEFGRRVAAVTDWDAATPDSEWTTRDLVAHVIDEQRWIPRLLTGAGHDPADHDHDHANPADSSPTQHDETDHTDRRDQTDQRDQHDQHDDDLEPVGDDLVLAWDRFASAATEAWRRAPKDAPVHLETDVVTAGEYLAEQTSDITIHTWDLARATGTDDSLPDELVQAVWQHFEPQMESLASTGLYAAPVEVPDDAPLQVRLLAVTGRDARVAA